MSPVPWPIAGASARLLTLGFAMLALASLPSCLVAAVGAGAAGSGYVAGQEKGVGALATDERIRVEINKKWFDYSSDMSGQLTLAVNNGEVLIAGQVSNPDWKVEAVRLAWQVDGVAEVINEIQIAEPVDMGQYMHDVWLAQQLRNKLLVDAKVRSVNYNIDCVAGTIYLMGVAQDQVELQRDRSCQGYLLCQPSREPCAPEERSGPSGRAGAAEARHHSACRDRQEGRRMSPAR